MYKFFSTSALSSAPRPFTIKPFFPTTHNPPTPPSNRKRFAGTRAAVVVFSYYPLDPRPKREAEALVRAGMEVELICLKKSGTDAAREVIDGVHVTRVPLRRRRGRKLTYMLQYAAFCFAAFVLLSARTFRKKYDLVHVHNMPDFLVFAALVPRFFGAKILLDLHDPMPELFSGIQVTRIKKIFVALLRLSEKWSIAFAHQVVTPNLAFAELFGSRSCNATKLDIVMNSPEPAFFSSPARQLIPPLERKGGFHLVFHGLLVERHGIDLAVRAVNELRYSIPNLHLHLYGEPTPHLQSVLDLSKTLGIEQFVHYYGFKTLPEIARAISSMDLGLIPNRLNPFTALNMPTRIFEYLAVKKPVIVPRTKGIQDYFAEDEIIYFEPGNLEDLIRKIQWIQTHPVEASEIVRKGYRIYEACRWDLQEQKLTDLISRLLPFPQSPRFVPSSQEHQTELATRRLARL